MWIIKIVNLLSYYREFLEGNSKANIIFISVDDNSHYSKILNSLLFSIKAKNIKTIVKVNEMINDKEKITMEYQALKNKIKILEKLINDKKSLKKNNNEGNKGNKKCFIFEIVDLAQSLITLIIFLNLILFNLIN